jgi:hypothetical protein
VVDTGTASLRGYRPAVPLSSRSLSIIAAGYTVEAAGLLALLTINGMSSVPSLALAATIFLIVAGFLLPTAGMLALRRRFDRTPAAVRNGFLLQGLGLIILLLGVLLAVILNSLTGFLIGTVFLATSAASGLLGSILLRKNYASLGLPGPNMASVLMLGTALLFSGVGVIMASNIAFFYILSGAANSIYTDVGATISACGCVAATYSFFEFRHD